MENFKIGSVSGILFLIVILIIQLIHGENVLTELKDKITHHNPNTTDEVTIYTESNYWGKLSQVRSSVWYLILPSYFL